jgi:hypothetical protein
MAKQIDEPRDYPRKDEMKLTCGCGQEYEIRDDTPKWAAPWIVCPDCFLADDIAEAPLSAHKKEGP